MKRSMRYQYLAIEAVRLKLNGFTYKYAFVELQEPKYREFNLGLDIIDREVKEGITYLCDYGVIPHMLSLWNKNKEKILKNLANFEDYLIRVRQLQEDHGKEEGKLYESFSNKLLDFDRRL